MNDAKFGNNSHDDVSLQHVGVANPTTEAYLFENHNYNFTHFTGFMLQEEIVASL